MIALRMARASTEVEEPASMWMDKSGLFLGTLI